MTGAWIVKKPALTSETNSEGLVSRQILTFLKLSDLSTPISIGVLFSPNLDSPISIRKLFPPFLLQKKTLPQQIN